VSEYIDGRLMVKQRKKSVIIMLCKLGIIILLILCWIWGTVALFFAGPGPDWIKMMLAISFGAFLPVIFIVFRSFLKGFIFCLACFTVLLVWWNTLQPTNNKDWAPDVARISHGEILGDRLVMHNVRDFRYSDEFTFNERWQTREYDLGKLKGLDVFLSYWASDNIAHLIFSWDFGSGEHLAISIETRKDKTQKYSAIKGFFKQFELSYAAADERDIIKLRTNYRKERVYLYRLTTPKETVRALLEDYLIEMNRLVDEPEFYNALTRNCATTAHLHVKAIHPDRSISADWRLIASGHLDELLYENRSLKGNDLPFAEIRKRSRVDLEMQKYNGDDFSNMLRKKATVE
jgi:hypothetical protein